MKFSFNRKAEINQSLDIVLPNKEVEKLVADKLKIAQKFIGVGLTSTLIQT